MICGLEWRTVYALAVHHSGPYVIIHILLVPTYGFTILQFYWAFCLVGALLLSTSVSGNVMTVTSAWDESDNIDFCVCIISPHKIWEDQPSGESEMQWYYRGITHCIKQQSPYIFRRKLYGIIAYNVLGHMEIRIDLSCYIEGIFFIT